MAKVNSQDFNIEFSGFVLTGEIDFHYGNSTVYLEINTLPLAHSFIELFEVIAIFEAFLAGQLPTKKVIESYSGNFFYKVVQKDKEVFLLIDLNPDDPSMHIYLSKLDVRLYLKFLKKVEGLVPVSSI